MSESTGMSSTMLEYVVYRNGTLTTAGQCLRDSVYQFVADFLSLFYILSPTETTKEDPYEVPDYEVSLLLAVSVLVFVEQFVRYLQRKDLSRFQDYVVNAGSALMFTLMRVFLLTTSVSVFVWVHTNCRLLDLPLHSLWTWISSLVLVEFTYYWVHRALHEVNVLWAAHQFHHMAEDINITTTIRDSMVDLIVYALFPLPLSLLVPPSVLILHVQFSLIYQVWLHNSVVGNLGPLEYVVNTPRQHRVHHGKNPYCIDKNFGALLMVWDRMFGTYQTEKESIVYGVVASTPHTFDSMTLQFGYYRDVWRKFRSVHGLHNKLSALFKGPGWAPGKPRLGLRTDIPLPDPSLPKYSHDPHISPSKKAYVALHGVVVVFGFYLLADHSITRFSPLRGLVGILYTILVLTSFGAIFDNRRWAPALEAFRCLTYFAFDFGLIDSILWPIGRTEQFMLEMALWTVRAIHGFSLCLCLCLSLYGSVTENYSPAAKKTAVAEEGGRGHEQWTAIKWHKLVAMAVALALAAIPFAIAFMLRLNSCKLMFNEWQ